MPYRGSSRCLLPAVSSQHVHQFFQTERQHEGEREAAIRASFSSLGIAPSRDYLAGNGGVPDATRVLHYPITGSTAVVTTLTRRILHELCGVSPAEAVDISYGDK